MYQKNIPHFKLISIDFPFGRWKIINLISVQNSSWCFTTGTKSGWEPQLQLDELDLSCNPLDKLTSWPTKYVSPVRTLVTNWIGKMDSRWSGQYDPLWKTNQQRFWSLLIWRFHEKMINGCLINQHGLFYAETNCLTDRNGLVAVQNQIV
jgi:hypothetical protein